MDNGYIGNTVAAHNAFAKGLLNDYSNFREVAKKADQTPIDTNPEPGLVSIDMEDNVHIDADFGRDRTVLTTYGAQKNLPEPREDFDAGILERNFFDRTTYTDDGFVLFVDSEYASELRLPPQVPDPSIDGTPTVNVRTTRRRAKVIKSDGHMDGQDCAGNVREIPAYMFNDPHFSFKK